MAPPELSLSHQQQAALAEVGEAAANGASAADLAAHYRTLESLVSEGLLEEVVGEGHEEPVDVRIRLTDAGWRVLQQLGPWSV